MSIFADVRVLIKRLRAAIAPNRDIWDSIAIVVALDSLHDDFEATTASMLERGDQTIEEIQQILASAEAKLISKRATGVTGDLVMVSRGRNFGKRKVASSDKCYNCHKLGHFGRDCKLPNQRVSGNRQDKRARIEDSSNQRQQQSRNQAHIVAADDDSNPEPFRPGMPIRQRNRRLCRPREESGTWTRAPLDTLLTTRARSLENFDQNALTLLLRAARLFV